MRKTRAVLRLTALCLILTGLSLALLSCGEPEDAFLLTRVRELLPEAVRMDALLYIDGVPTVGAASEYGYLQADAEALAALGFSSVADIKAKLREIWTENYCVRQETSAIFSAVSGAVGSQSYAYLIDETTKDGAFVGVKVLAAGLPLPMDRVTYDMDSLAVTWKSRKSAKFSITATVTNADGETQTRTGSLTLSEDTDGVWRLDAGTTMKFRYDSYDKIGQVPVSSPEKENAYGIR